MEKVELANIVPVEETKAAGNIPDALTFEMVDTASINGSSFDEINTLPTPEEDAALFGSIRDNGVESPITVDPKSRKVTKGFNRFRHAKALEMSQVPVIWKNYKTDKEALQDAVLDGVLNRDRSVDQRIAMYCLGFMDEIEAVEILAAAKQKEGGKEKAEQSSPKVDVNSFIAQGAGVGTTSVVTFNRNFRPLTHEKLVKIIKGEALPASAKREETERSVAFKPTTSKESLIDFSKRFPVIDAIVTRHIDCGALGEMIALLGPSVRKGGFFAFSTDPSKIETFLKRSNLGKGKLVVDPFARGGALGRTASEMGYRFIGRVAQQRKAG